MNNYEKFKEKIYKKTGINLSYYKERQMKRRIDSLIKRNNFINYEDYYTAINKDKKLFDEFINYLTINVSEFFRNPNQWKILQNEIFPLLLKRSKRLKIWSAACSTGDEPYSLAMALSESVSLNNVTILATDIDNEAINKAKVGIYSPKSVANVPKHLLNKYFTKIGESYKISEEIKKHIKFSQHNLLSDSYPDKCDLIVCRNVMIYFTEECKEMMYKKFYDSLNDDGILFVGSTEQIILPTRYNLDSFRTFFYKKI
ncbi:protein-glutamate O-methyltransferase CheR [Crassaminicella thermophila]|uniref:protein-glutamate O-methyltransferase n=1 Tax=Crassaminicella thermophila TaxID=2599308 RepID=A0A5C0SGT5_CRATE|nr:protein-glutamate O-methyltransferase CheR [Crassaminicella thermophila]QEK12179.1 protein-glutamate O-methyltransferase CheR [Crassaminicella thermophila]